MYLFKPLLASPENKAVNEIKSFLFSERGRREVLYRYICASFADIAPPPPYWATLLRSYLLAFYTDNERATL